MKKLHVFNMVTLDGFFEGPDHDISWHRVDEEFNEYAIDQLNSTDGLIFGRVTYQLMASYWPTSAALSDDPIVAGKMNSLPKYVFSRTLEKAEWNHTQLVKGNAVEEIRKLKQQPGKDLFIFGSADLASSLIPHGIIDEYRLIISPIVLGSGTPFFRDIRRQFDLKLLRTRTFRNGNVLLVYAHV